MKFLNVQDLNPTAEVWQDLPTERDMVVMSEGRPIAVLSTVTKSTLEETLTMIRRARAIIAANEMQRRSAELGHDQISLDEINDEVTSARRTLAALREEGRVTWSGGKPKGLRDVEVRGEPVSTTILENRR